MITTTPPTEAQAQAALFEFLTRIEGRIPDLRWAFHPANGGWRHKATAVALKRQGVKRGVPDVLLPVSSGNFTGFACELKTEHGRVKPEQEDAARELLRYLGYQPQEFGL